MIEIPIITSIRPIIKVQYIGSSRNSTDKIVPKTGTKLMKTAVLVAPSFSIPTK